jgi:hypothetical protein
MRRRDLITLAGSVVTLSGAAGLVGCGPFGSSGAPTPQGSGAGAGTTPSGLPTPSFPPSTAPIVTALRVDNAALMLWFSRASDGTPAMTSVWYNTASGSVVTGPAPLTSVQAGPAGPGFRSAVAAADQEGRVVVYGWLIGPVAQVWLDWKGTKVPGTLVNWPGDQTLQAYWLRAGAWVPVADAPASAAPSGSPTPAGPQPANLVGADSKGQPAFTLPLAPGR